MINQILSILVSVVMVLSIVGCDKISEFSQPGAKEVLNSYLDASLKNRSEEAYGYVSSEDKAVKSLTEYKSETDKKDNPFAAVVVSNVSYKVLQVIESGSTANADVEITLPDMGVMFKDIMGAAFSSAFGGKDKGEIKKINSKKIRNRRSPDYYKKGRFPLAQRTRWLESIS